MSRISLAALVLGFAISGIALAAEPAGKPSLVVLGTVHFANPGKDSTNLTVEDVLTPERQREIEALVDQLAAAKPTHVAIEWKASDQAGLDKRYQDYRAGRYKLGASEHDQIGLRLAAKLNLPRVDAVDWNDNPPGPEAAYDFPAWLASHGRQAEWNVLLSRMQALVDAIGQRQRCTVVSDWFRHLAEPATHAAFAASDYQIATFGDAIDNPGAAWVGTWMARNLRILVNVQRIAAKPEDRTIMIFGVGHAPWLTRFGHESGVFDMIDPLTVLPPAISARC